ncbi:hypothetical protein T484DRAFT_3134447 [Baffinella frigidus]|nr:hypothetical protein T484DRAFT_3134447 [Cryptophyta sp. CCMP2293]|mmetsp:Transcript_32196/g.73586  ORF Transcript_32196/g.73586 Transcript_32196/m.73586 type:complete len:245 (-) Transcript_32196:125-859(-)
MEGGAVDVPEVVCEACCVSFGRGHVASGRLKNHQGTKKHKTRVALLEASADQGGEHAPGGAADVEAVLVKPATRRRVSTASEAGAVEEAAQAATPQLHTSPARAPRQPQRSPAAPPAVAPPPSLSGLAMLGLPHVQHPPEPTLVKAVPAPAYVGSNVGSNDGSNVGSSKDLADAPRVEAGPAHGLVVGSEVEVVSSRFKGEYGTVEKVLGATGNRLRIRFHGKQDTCLLQASVLAPRLRTTSPL